MASIYDIDFSILVIETLPVNKRADKTKAWLNALSVTIVENHDEIFNVFRPYIKERAKQNGQKIILEDILNTEFAVVGPAYIYIDNTGDDKRPVSFYNEFEGYPPVTLFNESEGQPPLYMVNNTETFQNASFKVYVPAATFSAFGEPKIRAEVDRLRPYSTNYIVISY